MADTKKKEPAFDIGPMPPAPVPRSLEDEMAALGPVLGGLSADVQGDYLKAQQDLLNQQGAYYARNYPRLTGQQFDAFSKIYPRYSEMQTQQALRQSQLFGDEYLRQQEQQRGANVDWLWQQGQTAQQAARYANPVWASEMDMLHDIAMRDVRKPLETSPFQAELDRRAMEELKLGGALTPEQERMAQQGARGAYAARGMAFGDAGALAEVLSRDSMAQQRLREREAIAGGREQAFQQRLGLGLQKEQMDRQFLMGSAALNEQTGAPWRILGGPTYVPPNLAPMQATGALGFAQGASQQLMGFTQGVKTPDPTGIYSAGLGYGSDLYNTNLNMAASQYNSWQNNSAALQAAQMQSQAQIQSAQLQAGAMGGTGGSGMGGALIGAGGAVIGAAIPAVIAAF